MDLLVVDLDKTATDKMSSRCIIFCYSYYLLEGSRNNSFGLLALIAAHHCMCFSATRLSISKNSTIITFKYIIDKGESTLFINECLCTVRCEDVVEREAFWLSFFILLDKIDLVVFGIDIHNTYTVSILLFLVHGSASDHNFDCFRHPSI